MQKILMILRLLIFIPQILFANTLITEPNEGLYPISQNLQSAHKIDLAIYGLTEKTALNALIAAQRNGKVLRVLIQARPYKAETENNFALQNLNTYAIPVHFPDARFQLLHQKTFILDDQKAIIMTFNLTHATFTNERNFAVIDDGKNEVKEISAVFNADWLHQAITPQEKNLVWSPDNSRAKILNLIATAKVRLQIYAESVSDYAIVGALAKAAKRGVDVAILTSLQKRQTPNRKFGFLQKSGVKIYFSHHLYVHAKVMIVDNQLALLGSVNFTQNSLDKNRELSVILHDAPIVHQLQKIFIADLNDNRLNEYSGYQKLPFLMLKAIKKFKSAYHFESTSTRKRYPHHKHHRHHAFAYQHIV